MVFCMNVSDIFFNLIWIPRNLLYSFVYHLLVYLNVKERTILALGSDVEILIIQKAAAACRVSPLWSPVWMNHHWYSRCSTKYGFQFLKDHNEMNVQWNPKSHTTYDGPFNETFLRIKVFMRTEWSRKLQK